ncbi:hypothetical protein [Hydrogenophaga crassostreae]|nr:hypothetical protein [Hydrogenophaga crassostreae]AOW13029.1 hypothetical protein LPB072_09400 [Hydrogenophaga crassostreae]
MNHRTSPKQPERLDEPLDIDEETLDSALMDLVTSDWQSLDDGDSSDDGNAERQSPPAQAPSH